MSSSRPRKFKVIIGVIVGVALLCSAVLIAYAATRDSGTPKAAASTTTSKKTPAKTKTPKTTSTTTTPTPTRPPVDCTKEKCVALTFDLSLIHI